MKVNGNVEKLTEEDRIMTILLKVMKIFKSINGYQVSYLCGKGAGSNSYILKVVCKLPGNLL